MPFYKNKQNHYNIVSCFSDERSLKYHLGVYAKGYHLAANQLSTNFISKNGYGDYEGYPIVFLYRHSLELYLKNIIQWSKRLHSLREIENSVNDYKTNHNLVYLNSEAEKALLSLFPQDEQLGIYLVKLKQVIIDFNEIDSDSYSYRYPINKKKKRATKKHQVVNIPALAKTMDEILSELSIISSGLNIETDIEFERVENENL